MEVSQRVVIVLSAHVQQKNQRNSVKNVVQLSQLQIIALSEAIQQVFHNNNAIGCFFWCEENWAVDSV